MSAKGNAFKEAELRKQKAKEEAERLKAQQEQESQNEGASLPVEPEVEVMPEPKVENPVPTTETTAPVEATPATNKTDNTEQEVNVSSILRSRYAESMGDGEKRSVRFNGLLKPSIVEKAAKDVRNGKIKSLNDLINQLLDEYYRT